MDRNTRSAISTLTVVLVMAVPRLAGAEIESTPHNFEPPAAALTQGRSATERPGTCLYCHVFHRTDPRAALWARSIAGKVYRLYESSTLEATLSQPTGASRICLSCHDGTLALGHLRALPATARASLQRGGRASRGTDLSGDHPISFVYDLELAGRRGELADPAGLPDEIRLDRTGQLQCTTCHDAHDNPYGNFLVVDNRNSQLCESCHHPDGWQGSVHATSLAAHTRGPDPWPHTAYQTVADNGCENCHRQHGAGHPEWILTHDGQDESCLVCHDDGLAETDVGTAFAGFSAHPVAVAGDVHKPNEDPLFMERHVTCSDCHDPHSMRASRSATAAVSAPDSLGRVSGVNLSGASVAVARSESEVCYKCHGLQEEADFLVTRHDNVTNTRLEFATSNRSFHPVETVGRNPEIEGLESDYTPSSMLSCGDCHGSDASETNGLRGPHGSTYEPILVREYQVADPSMESFQSYSLCYRCHNRSTLLTDRGGFSHRRHVVEAEASCAVCHDAHGSRNSPSLINFMRLGKTGEEVVTPSSEGCLEYQPAETAMQNGRCFLTCHNVDHNEQLYAKLRAPASFIERPCMPVSLPPR